MWNLTLKAAVVLAAIGTLLAVIRAIRDKQLWPYCVRIILFYWTGIMSLYLFALAASVIGYQVFYWLINGEEYSATFYRINSCWVWAADWCATKSYWYDESAIGLSQLIRGFLNWHASILLYLLSWIWAALHCSAMYERDRLDLDEFFLFLPASPTRELDEARK